MIIRFLFLRIFKSLHDFLRHFIFFLDYLHLIRDLWHLVIILICKRWSIPDTSVGAVNRSAQIESLPNGVPPACLAAAKIVNELKTLRGLLNIGLSGGRILIHVRFLLSRESRGLWGVCLRLRWLGHGHIGGWRLFFKARIIGQGHLILLDLYQMAHPFISKISVDLLILSRHWC